MSIYSDYEHGLISESELNAYARGEDDPCRKVAYWKDGEKEVEKICGTCKWHIQEKQYKFYSHYRMEGLCSLSDGERWTDNELSCEEALCDMWEQRGVE